MDIAKIRKKAREKEAAGKSSPETPPEAQAPQPQEPAQPAGQGAVPPEAGADTEAASEEELPSGPGEETGAPETPPEYAAAPAAEEQGEEVLELLTFTLAQEEFAFRVPEVEEIIRHQKITRVPTMPGFVCGITSLRGKIIPVIDLKARLILRESGGPAAQDAPEESVPEADKRAGKILILAGPKGLIGAAIDRVLGVVRFPREKIFEPPSHLSEEELQYIEGVVTVDKRFISIIRAEAALTIEVS